MRRRREGLPEGTQEPPAPIPPGDRHPVSTAAMRLWIWVAVSASALVGVGSVAAAPKFTIASPAFRAGGTIPKRFTCDGADVSPPLRWNRPPAGTRSFSISVVDLDNGFIHWLGWGLPPARRGLAVGQHPPHQAVNDFGRRGYGGPCPPAGVRHRYRFSLYALDAPVGPPFARHVLAVARITAFYR